MQKKSKNLLIVAIILMLVGTLVSGAVQSSFGRVDVREISLVTEVGTLTGYLLVPRSATVDTPAPAIVTSHGYLNNREMQDINYVELSRRGYVVFVMNAYKHGDSSVPEARFAETISVRSGGMVDAVEYLAGLPFVDASRIGVTGHSMGGGFTTTTATYYSQLEREALANGMDAEAAKALNKVAAALPVGMYPGELAANPDLSGGSGLLCDLGIIMGSYDEFFAAAGYNGAELLESDLSRNLVAVQTGIQVSGAVEQGMIYINPDNGSMLAFYIPRETHAQNHFSTASAGYLVTFFEEALPAPHPLPASNQTWWLKELFNFIGLVGFFLFIVPFADLVLGLKIFEPLRAANVPAEPALMPGKARRRYVTSIVINVLLCTLILFPAMMAGYLLMISPLLPQDTTGGVALWALMCGLVGLLALRIGAGKFKRRCAAFGVKVSWRTFLKIALLAVVVVGCTYVWLFLADTLFQTDFRIWSFDLRVFAASKIWVAIKYLPFFLAYFIVNSILISRGTFANWSERKQTWMAVMLNALTPAVFLALSFLPLLFNDFTFWGLALGQGSLLSSAGALVPILMIPFLPILGIAGYINLKFYKMTGNIWLGALVNAILITMITVANTSFSFAY